ncbi:MAG: D-alanine--D-alanine ligase [Clostridiales Family XIII bacterium]|jgi:D-alanine-D-alanine ligase|nr:D-alanine--D-alanine ligase [Clostridiales Family XIII bacterium]
MDRIGIIFGGRSQEHEISILSAASVMDAVDRTRHEIIPVAIAKDGSWFRLRTDISGLNSLDDPRIEDLIPKDGIGTERAVRISIGEIAGLVDFAFPVLHGPYGEDGTIQGLFEMTGLPYAGCGVTSSAISMDKIFSKELLLRAGLPVLKYDATYRWIFGQDRDGELSRIESTLGYPVFIKPANMGSSVGVGRAEDREALAAAIDEALRYDDRVLIETEMKGRELEVAVLGADKPVAAEAGEIVIAEEFYDYDTKYKSGTADLQVPAKLTPVQRDEIRSLAVRAFKALGGNGFARVDFFLDEASGKLYINEMNTIPGFTGYSMFPLLWGAAGIEYTELIERIIELGYERYHLKNNG